MKPFLALVIPYFMANSGYANGQTQRQQNQEMLLKHNICQKFDLEGASLAGAYLTEANLKGANIRDANLRGANVSSAYLIGTDIRGAHLENDNLTGSFLSGVNFSRLHI